MFCLSPMSLSSTRHDWSTRGRLDIVLLRSRLLGGYRSGCGGRKVIKFQTQRTFHKRGPPSLCLVPGQPVGGTETPHATKSSRSPTRSKIAPHSATPNTFNEAIQAPTTVSRPVRLEVSCKKKEPNVLHFYVISPSSSAKFILFYRAVH